MAANTWRSRPNLDPSRWRNIRQIAGGRWTADRIPQAAPAAGPAAAPPPAAAAPPAAPPPLPVNTGFAVGLQNLQVQREALPGIYNPLREGLAVNTARSLTDQGLVDIASETQLAGNAQGNQFGVTTRGEGQQLRDAVTGAAASFNARGTAGSTWQRREQDQSRLAQRNALQAVLRGLQGEQQGLNSRQQEDFQRISGEERSLGAEYRDWQANQQVAPAPTQPEVPGPGEASSSAPRRWVGASRPSLDPSQWNIVRRGPNAPANQRWVATRR